MAYDDDNTQPATTPQPATPPPPQPPGPGESMDTAGLMINPKSNFEQNPTMLPSRGVQSPDPGSAGNTPVPQPTAENHLSWIGRVLDKVASALGGDQTYRITKKPDGTMEASYEPSTEKEKWGRIAAAALGGAAQGLANSQGPGGLARAASAGVQYGFQQPQQQRQEVQQQVDFQNKQLLAKANRIHLTQETYMLAQDAKLKGLAIDKATQEVLGNYWGAMAKHGVDYGVVDPGNPNSAVELAQTRPGAWDDFLGKGNRVMRYVMEPDHKMHMIGVDQDFEKRRNTEPMDMPSEEPDPKNNNKPTLVMKPENRVPVNGDTMENIHNAKAAIYKDYYSHLDSWSKAQKETQPAQEKVPTTDEGAIIQAELARTPNDRTGALDRAAAKIQANKEKTRAITVNQAANPYQAPAAGTEAATKVQSATASGAPIIGKQWGGGDPNSAFERVAKMLYTHDMAPSQIRQMRGKGNPQQADYIARADQIDREAGGPGVSPASLEEEYQAARKVEMDYSAAGKTGQKIGAFSTLLEHLGDVHDSVQELRNTGSPYLNKKLNVLQRDIAGNVNVGPAAIRAAAPSQEYARVLANNQALDKDEKAELPNLLNENQTPAMQQENSKQMVKTIIDRMDPVFQGYRTSRGGKESPTQLTPRAIQVLKNMGLYDYAMSRLHPNGQVPPEQRTPPPQQNTGGQQQQNAGGQQSQSKGNRSVAQAMQLPQNKGKTQQQVEDDLRKFGYTPTP